jgi:hypothetical protein
MKTILLALIRFYQAAAAGWLRPRCRFWPSCSEYAREAVDRHGAARGAVLSLHRFIRCRPFGGAGVDPVPEELSCPRI